MKKKSPPRTGKTDIDRAISDIYKDLNELIEAVNSSASPERASHTGNSGDVRLIKSGKNGYTLEGKFDDGWASVNMTLKEKK